MIDIFCGILWLGMLFIGWIKLYRGATFENFEVMLISKTSYILASSFFVINLKAVLESAI